MKSMAAVCCLILAPTCCAATYHVDPGAEPGGDGSIEKPLRAWAAVSAEEEDEVLFRRGAEHEAESITLRAGMTLGAYGDGPRPLIRSLAEGRKHGVSGWRAHGSTVRGLEVSAPRASGCVTFSEANDCTVEDCVLHDATWGLRSTGASSGARIVSVEVYNTADDGMFIQWARDFEIARCHVHHVNTNFEFPYTPQTEAAGDSIQLSHCDNWHVHHCLLDRSDSGNKFCFISNDEQTKGLLEHNVLFGPLPVGDGGSGIYMGQGGRGVTVRQNLIMGPTGTGIYHHTAGLVIEGNIFVGMPRCLMSLGPADPEPDTQLNGNVLFAVDEAVKGHDYTETGNLEAPGQAGLGATALCFATGDNGTPRLKHRLAVGTPLGEAVPELALEREGHDLNIVTASGDLVARLAFTGRRDVDAPVEIGWLAAVELRKPEALPGVTVLSGADGPAGCMVVLPGTEDVWIVLPGTGIPESMKGPD